MANFVNNSQLLTKVNTIIKSKKIFFVFVLLSYIFFTIFYMGPSIWNCNNTLYGFGDNTAGPVWRFGLEPKQSPLGSFQNMTNYPVGENLYSPTNYSLSGQSYIIWAASRTLGPICGYNVINAVGFIVSALVMYGMINTLTRKKWLAWLAGYAVSFTPYYQMKVGGHPGYGYQALLIASTWAFFNLIKHKRKRDMAYFAILSASSFYFDPYFSLLLVTIISPLVLAWLSLLFVYHKKNNNFKILVKSRIKLLGQTGILLLVLLIPLIFVTVKNSKIISASVAATRGNVLFEAQACSNFPHEYFTPFVLHPIFERLIGKSTYNTTVSNLANDFTCGIGEDSVGISIVVLIITITGMLILFWEILNRRKVTLNLGYDRKMVIFGMTLVLLTGIIFALPPVKLFDIIPTPTYMLLQLTTTWRTLTRLYVVVNFAVITLFSVILVYILSNFRKINKYFPILFILVFISIFLEYQAFKPFTGNKLSTFSYKSDTPAVYKWLRDQEDILTIAEYPLEKSGGESNAMAYYLSMQVAHKKKLFNGNIPSTNDESLKASLKDISDSQTIQVLSSVGVDAVVIHGVTESEVSKIEGLEVIYTASQSKFNLLSFTPLVKNDAVVVARIKRQPIVDNMMTFYKGFVRNTNIIRSAIDWDYEAVNGSIIKIAPIPGKESIVSSPLNRCFDVRMSGDFNNAKVTIKADNNIFEKHIDSNFVTFEVMAKDYIVLTNDKGYNMQIRNLGCK